MIYDSDTGGKPEHFSYTVKNLERLGVSAVVIEDKVGLKNSLFGTEVPQQQDSIEDFCNKIRVGKNSQVSEDFYDNFSLRKPNFDQGMMMHLKDVGLTWRPAQMEL